MPLQLSPVIAGGGGANLTEVEADLLYLRLDGANVPVTGALIIDSTDVEAFVVRKSGDTGDIFRVDTTNSEIEIVSSDLVITEGVQTTTLTGLTTSTNVYTADVTSSGLGANQIVAGYIFSPTPHVSDDASSIYAVVGMIGVSIDTPAGLSVVGAIAEHQGSGQLSIFGGNLTHSGTGNLNIGGGTLTHTGGTGELEAYTVELINNTNPVSNMTGAKFTLQPDVAGITGDLAGIVIRSAGTQSVKDVLKVEGTFIDGIDLSQGTFTNDLHLQNGETINNVSDGIIAMPSAIFQVDEIQDVGNDATLSFSGGGGIDVVNAFTAGSVESDAGITFAGDMTSTGAAVDWDLIDDTASALSFDSTGKTGILEIDTDDGFEGIRTSGFLETSQGSDLASANDMAEPTGNYCDVTGAVQINTMVAVNKQAGSFVTLQFDDAPTVKHNTAGAGAIFLLAGAGDFAATANDTLTIVYDGTNWREVARTAI